MKKILVLLILLGVSYTTINAEEQSLAQLIDIALSNNYDVQIARLQLEGAQAGKIGSFSGFLPSIGFTVQKDFNPSNMYGLESPDYLSSLYLSQTIFDGARSWFYNRSTANAIDYSRVNLKSYEESVVFQVKSAYYDHLSALELLEVSEFSLELAKSQLELVQQQFNLQAVSKTDLLKAEVRKGQARAQLIQAKQNLNFTKNQMNLVVGQSNGQFLAIKNNGIELNPILELEVARKSLLENNSQIQIARNSLKGTKIAYNTQIGVFFPTVSLSSGYSSYQYELEDIYDGYKSAKPTTSLTVSLPLFNGITNISQLNQQKYNVLVAEEHLHQLHNALLVELENTINSLETYHELLPINEEIIRSAEMDVELANEKYNLGSATILDVLNAQVSLIQAKSDLVQTKYNAKKTEAQLDVLLGKY